MHVSVSNFTSAFFSFILVFYPFFIFAKLQRLSESELKEDEMLKSRFGTIYDGLKVSQK